MELLNKFIELLWLNISVPYMACVWVLTWLVLNWVIKFPTDFEKKVITAGAGLILFLVFLFWFKEKAQTLFTSFWLAVVLYDWVLKYFKEKYLGKYNNGKGLV